MAGIYAPTLVEEKAAVQVTAPLTDGIVVDASSFAEQVNSLVDQAVAAKEIPDPATPPVTPEQVNVLADQLDKGPTEVVQDLQKTPLADAPVQVPATAIAETVKVSNKVSDPSIPEQGQALLNLIAMHESAGDYNVIVGQGKAIPGTPGSFESYAEHPRVVGMRTSAGPSTAAGRYQITATTWDYLRSKYPDLVDFSPVSQDRAAWRLAQTDYSKRTGRDLLQDLSTGQTQFVKQALKRTWTSLYNVDVTSSLNNLLGVNR